MWTNLNALANTQPTVQLMVALAFMVFFMSRMKTFR